MGFATFQAYVDSARTQARHRSMVKTAGTQVVNIPYTWWRTTGMPAAGGVPTVGLGGAVATDKNTVGALEITNAPVGQQNWISRFALGTGTTSTTLRGTFILVDRLAHANITNNQATGNFAPVIDGTARLAAGEGAQIIMEVTTALSAASNTRTFTYTNEAGTASRVTQNIVTVASAVIDRVPYADFIWVPLQAGDRGVRSIESTTLVAGTATGNYSVALVRPLAYLTTDVFSRPNEREYGAMKQFLLQIPDNACLYLLQLVTTIGTSPVYGGITVVSG